MEKIMGSNRKIKILFILKNFSRSGGVEKVTLNLANQLLDQGHEVGLYIMDGTKIPTNILSQYKTFIGNKGGIKGVVKYFLHLSNYINCGQYNLVISAKEQANLLNSLVSLINRNFAPVYTRHCAFDVSEQDLSVNNIARLYAFYGKTRGKIVAVSDDLAKYMMTRIPKIKDKIISCPNPVVSDSLYLKASTNTNNFEINKPYMCAVGRLCEQKGFDLLLESYRFAMDENSNLPDLIIVGEGPDLNMLKEQCIYLGIQNNVHFTGYTTNPYFIMENSELFLLSSRHEGLPTVLIEALAIQKNIVAFDCPTGPHEILEGGKYGSLVAIGNTKGFAKSINYLLKNPMNIPADAVERYKYKSSSDAYLALAIN
ncbi:MAG: glycosyltransferase [Saccharospirillaceae bacterium]|nr:glycosyltransferase [Saccharospirillaceae bacterium]